MGEVLLFRCGVRVLYMLVCNIIDRSFCGVVLLLRVDG